MLEWVYSYSNGSIWWCHLHYWQLIIIRVWSLYQWIGERQRRKYYMLDRWKAVFRWLCKINSFRIRAILLSTIWIRCSNLWFLSLPSNRAGHWYVRKCNMPFRRNSLCWSLAKTIKRSIRRSYLCDRCSWSNFFLSLRQW